MKIAVTFQNKRSISGHAGRVTRFLIFTVENQKVVSKDLLELPKEQTFHSLFHDGVQPQIDHPLYTVQAIITGNSGPGFIRKMKLNNIDPLLTSETDPDTAIQKLIEGTLEIIPVDPSMHRHHH
jgi:predicted Fe-Mo cluster-binding NifX family protein